MHCSDAMSANLQFDCFLEQRSFIKSIRRCLTWRAFGARNRLSREPSAGY